MVVFSLLCYVSSIYVILIKSVRSQPFMFAAQMGDYHSRTPSNWLPYSDTMQDEINQAFNDQFNKKPNHTLCFENGQGTYLVDLKTMTSTHIETHTETQVRRTSSNVWEMRTTGGRSRSDTWTIMKSDSWTLSSVNDELEEMYNSDQSRICIFSMQLQRYFNIKFVAATTARLTDPYHRYGADQCQTLANWKQPIVAIQWVPSNFYRQRSVCALPDVAASRPLLAPRSAGTRYGHSDPNSGSGSVTDFFDVLSARADTFLGQIGRTSWPGDTTPPNNDFRTKQPSGKAVIDFSKLEKDMESSHVLLHASVITDMVSFVKHQISIGSYNNFFKKFQKANGNIDILQYVDRLITKRAVYFFNPSDDYKLIDGTTGRDNWNALSTVRSNMDKHLTYDELMFNAQSGISSHTQFINDGNRNNRASIETDLSKIETNGVYTGLVGARFEKPGVMEYATMMVNDKHIDKRKLFYRLETSLELFLFDANQRGQDSKQNVFAYIVGLGGGFWAPHGDNAVINDAIIRITKQIMQSVSLPNIEVINFAWMGDSKQTEIIQVKSKKTVKFQFNKRNPGSKLNDINDPSSDCQGCLLVAMYAWDSNALPGNEYWKGALDASGDPAAAACSTITITQNPHLNQGYVNAKHAKVYWRDFDTNYDSYHVATLPQYLSKHSF